MTAAFINKETGEIKEQTVFMGDFPMMTEKGTFIINGTERVVVRQLVRSPGVYFDRSVDKTSDKDIYACKVIPARGAWLEFETDKRDTVGVRVDRKRRQYVTVLLKALGFGDDKEILELFEGAESIAATLEKDTIETQEEASDRRLPQAPSGRAAHGRERTQPDREPVLQPQAIRPRSGRSLQGQRKLEFESTRRRHHGDGIGPPQRGHPRDDPLPGEAARR